MHIFHSNTLFSLFVASSNGASKEKEVSSWRLVFYNSIMMNQDKVDDRERCYFCNKWIYIFSLSIYLTTQRVHPSIMRSIFNDLYENKQSPIRANNSLMIYGNL